MKHRVVFGGQRRWSILILCVSCSGAPDAIEGERVVVDFASAAFYDAPFPSAHRIDADGRMNLDDFPNPRRIELMRLIRQLAARDTSGFGRTSGIFFRTTAAPSMTPTLHTSIEPGAAMFLMNVGDVSPGTRVPIRVDFQYDGGPHGTERLLSLLPLQGVPLDASTAYAAVVTRDAYPGVSADVVGLLDGHRPQGMREEVFETYRLAIDTLETQGVDHDEIAALAVFDTGDPERDLRAARAIDLMPPVTVAPTVREVFDDFCVFEGEVKMPVYQAGDPPYTTGGHWVFDGDELVLQRMADARIVVTVPRVSAPPDGYPGVVFIRTGGGGDRPLVDRGVRRIPGGDAIEPGSGPARNFARAGYAAVSVDGPHGGLRNPRNRDEQLLIFNLDNFVAMRDNLRQSALEIALVRRMLDDLVITSTACPGATARFRFDPARVALMGHSMGATIAPLTLAMEPTFSSAILSGAGGSWIENIVHKQSPLPTKPIAELLLEYPDHGDDGYEIHAHDPALSMLQWAGESADPPVYAASIDIDVLMFQGVTDTYILPPIANALSLSLGLDLAGPALDESLGALLGFVGRSAVVLPASSNRDGRTRVVVQHAQDDVEDGHEVVFQLEGPKHQYRCFLEGVAADDRPTVVVAGTEFAPCD